MQIRLLKVASRVAKKASIEANSDLYLRLCLLEGAASNVLAGVTKGKFTRGVMVKRNMGILISKLEEAGFFVSPRWEVESRELYNRAISGAKNLMRKYRIGEGKINPEDAFNNFLSGYVQISRYNKDLVPTKSGLFETGKKIQKVRGDSVFSNPVPLMRLAVLNFIKKLENVLQPVVTQERKETTLQFQDEEGKSHERELKLDSLFERDVRSSPNFYMFLFDLLGSKNSYSEIEEEIIEDAEEDIERILNMAASTSNAGKIAVIIYELLKKGNAHELFKVLTKSNKEIEATPYRMIEEEIRRNYRNEFSHLLEGASLYNAVSNAFNPIKGAVVPTLYKRILGLPSVQKLKDIYDGKASIAKLFRRASKRKSASPSGKFRVYRNLHTGGWSVQHKGRVVMHVDPQDTLILKDPRPEILQGGANRAMREKQRNVHAFLSTTSLPVVLEGNQGVGGEAVTYYPPHISDLGWHYKSNKAPFEGARIAYLTEGRNVVVK